MKEQIKLLTQHLETTLNDIDDKSEKSGSGAIVFAAHDRSDGVQFLGTACGDINILFKSIIHGMLKEGNLEDNIEVVSEAHDVLCKALTALKIEQQIRIKQN